MEKIGYTKEELEKAIALAEYKFQNDMNVIQHSYVDIAGDMVAGALLRQILYWFTPDKNGKLKVRVKKDGHYWLAKERSEWYDEIRITVKQYTRAVKVLEDKKLIFKAKYKFNGQPIVHLRPNYEVLNQKIEEWKREKVEELLGVVPESTKGNFPAKSTVTETEETAEPANSLGSDQRYFPEDTKGTFPKIPKVLSGSDERVVPLTETTTETTTESTYKDNNNNKRKKEVVVVVELIYQTFDKVIRDSEAISLIETARQHNKNLADVINETREHFSRPDVPKMKTLMGALKYGIVHGWNEPVVPAIRKRRAYMNKLPKAVAKKEQAATVPEEELQATYEDINSLFSYLKTTESKYLNRD